MTASFANVCNFKVYPYIHYGNIVWANNYPSKLTRIVLLQKRAVRIIAKVGYRESAAEIFKELKLLRVEQINELEILNSDV